MRAELLETWSRCACSTRSPGLDLHAHPRLSARGEIPTKPFDWYPNLLACNHHKGRCSLHVVMCRVQGEVAGGNGRRAEALAAGPHEGLLERGTKCPRLLLAIHDCGDSTSPNAAWYTSSALFGQPVHMHVLLGHHMGRLGSTSLAPAEQDNISASRYRRRPGADGLVNDTATKLCSLDQDVLHLLSQRTTRHGHWNDDFAMFQFAAATP